jgi:hypothetical protein
VAPAVSVLPASGLTASTATLNAAVNPNGAFTVVYFQYGLTLNYGSYSSSTAFDATNVTLSISNLISGLSPGTSYHFQFVAANGYGTTPSPNFTLTTTVQAANVNLTRAVKLPGGAFQFSFTNFSGLGFTVLGATNLETPWTNWTVLGSPVESPAGQYQFTDPHATNAGCWGAFALSVASVQIYLPFCSKYGKSLMQRRMRKPKVGAAGRENHATRWFSLGIAATTLSLATAAAPSRANDTNITNDVQFLREQNAMLQRQLQKQNEAIDALTKKVDALESAARENQGDESGVSGGGFNLGKVNLSAEGGVAFFNTGSDGFAPHSDFRVDEARLFVEAPIWDSVYFFSDIDLATRENNDTQLYLGELYLDCEDVSHLWGQDGQLNVRAGRMFIPFGEEYMYRYAMENSLISHSLADFWGIDPGVEIYGKLGKFSYVAAVQNGGGSGVQDFDGDKSVAGRIAFDPSAHWHFSVSGMRTGDLNVRQDMTSALWFGNGWFRSIGSPATTRFHADLVEGDVTARWNGGHARASGGYARYEDNDPAGGNGRELFYYSVEVTQDLPARFYAAARFSQILAPHGYPIAGFGNYGEYFFSDLTTEIWRLSLGLGYRFNDRLTLKAEYAFERGKDSTGEIRDNEDFFGTEAAFKF